MVTHTFKNLTAKAARFLQSVSAYFGTLYIKGSKLDYEICTQKPS